MKLNEAKEILEHPPFYPNTPSDWDYADAIKLGIEALKAVKLQRKVISGHPIPLLPGETPE